MWLSQNAHVSDVLTYCLQTTTEEDYYFAIKLKAYGKQKRLKYGTIRQGYIVTSCRKFDQFGDWYFFKNPNLVKEIFTGTNQKAANEFYYDVDR